MAAQSSTVEEVSPSSEFSSFTKFAIIIKLNLSDVSRLSS